MRAWRLIAIALMVVFIFCDGAFAVVPLSMADLETLLRSKVSSSRIVKLVKERKISIDLSKETVRRLKGMGATMAVINAVDRNNLPSMQIASEPSGAEIFVDGRYKGTTPLLIWNLAWGRHSLMLGKVAGYHDYVADITLSPGQNWENNIQLKKREESLATATSPPPQTPLSQERPEVVAVTPALLAVNPVTQPVMDKLNVAEVLPKLPAARPLPPPKTAERRQLVVVRVRTEPVSADIYLDDKYIGVSPAEFLATVGNHHLKLIPTLSTKYETVQKDLSIRSNDLNSVFLRLDSKLN